jgi:alkylation response protein AidB-like acyl-CoA dehydrogenase
MSDAAEFVPPPPFDPGALRAPALRRLHAYWMQKAAGRDIPGAGNIAKLSMSEIVRQSRDLGLRIAGAAGTLHAYDSAHRRALDAATGQPMLGHITEMALFAQAPPIYGGTDQVQKNIIGERALGLPKEPSNDRTMAWSDLPKNG